MMDVSFIVPAYKPEKRWITDCIKAIIRTASAHPGLKCEILIGDDGSPAGTFGYASELEMLSPMVKFFRFAENRGAGEARNELIAKSSGRYIMPQDCDDIMLPFDLGRVVKFMDDNRKYSASYARKYCFNDNGIMNERHGDRQSSFCAFFQPRVNINCMLIRREICIAAGGFSPLPFSRINEDVRLMFYLFEHSPLYYDDVEPRTLYRKHSNQISTNSDTGQNDWRWMAHDMLLRHADIAAELLRGRIPHGRTEEEERLICALTGAMVFMHQKDRNLCPALCSEYLRRHPEDHGGWESYMTIAMINNDAALFDSIYDQAMKLFDGQAEHQYYFVMNALKNANLHKRDAGKLNSILQQLAAEYHRVPEIAAANCPVKPKAVYSWKI